MVAILSENRKKEYPRSVTELLSSARSLVLHKQNSNIYLKISIRYVRKEEEANVQNINSILSDLG
jgi:hypothetical protein